ncbi:MAG: sulfatase-like hydrolase/transferase, partial [Armatimonadota bacterium]|nr:sulfatase-like hydrolase/transferase [Armatimonadota bacterium]
MDHRRPRGSVGRITRRGFLRGSAAGLGALAAGSAASALAPVSRKPNLLLILCDQMNLDALSCLGNPHVHTPHLDRLAAQGTLFLESHTTNPVCSPARSSLMTGRMPVETGVIQNDLPTRPGLPHLGEWLRDQAGYEAVYCGKWHLSPPPNRCGFRVLPGQGGQGAADDYWVSRSCSAYLRHYAARPARPPLVMVASYLQPHDICYWMIYPDTLVSHTPLFPAVMNHLPALPPNHRSRPPGPAAVGTGYDRFATDAQWHYYLYCYYRMVEMLDSDVGR